MAMRTAINDTGTSPSLLVFGEHLALPALAVETERTYPEEHVSDFVIKLRQDLKVLRDFVTTIAEDQQQEPDKVVFNHKFVWLLDPMLKNSLSPKYKGPYKVLSSKQYPVLLLDIDGNEKRINVDRVKPAPRMNELPPFTWKTDDRGVPLPLDAQPERFGVEETVEGLVNSQVEEETPGLVFEDLPEVLLRGEGSLPAHAQTLPPDFDP
jgi:hypothetical protein